MTGVEAESLIARLHKAAEVDRDALPEHWAGMDDRWYEADGYVQRFERYWAHVQEHGWDDCSHCISIADDLVAQARIYEV